MPTAISVPTLFPILTPDVLLAFQFSSWYPRFASKSIKSTIIKPLTQDFHDYLRSDGVFLPEGSEDLSVRFGSCVERLEDSTDNSDADEDEESREPRRMFAFPELDAKIRDTVKQYGAVFPKLNFSSPRDAAWMLPPSFPLKCTAPSDVYSLLKSSDFILHDLDEDHVFEGCDSGAKSRPEYTLELVLRKWYPVDRSRELRCFVRREILLGISQRDPNYYDFWNEHGTQQKVVDALTRYWEENVKGKWEDTDGNYIFDFLLSRDFAKGHIIDFNPYAPRTDPLLFEYEELLDLLTEASSVSPSANHYHPVLKVVDSRSHPAAARNAPIYQHNMVPMEALALSGGRNVEEFAEVWQEQLRQSTEGTYSDDES
ncbi:D123-domain-containing protein [Cytidiella melzeri]|nr:D123-domain-containing protein [Cytidiella melzeri]